MGAYHPDTVNAMGTSSSRPQITAGPAPAWYAHAGHTCNPDLHRVFGAHPVFTLPNLQHRVMWIHRVPVSGTPVGAVHWGSSVPHPLHKSPTIRDTDILG